MKVESNGIVSYHIVYNYKIQSIVIAYDLIDLSVDWSMVEYEGPPNVHPELVTGDPSVCPSGMTFDICLLVLHNQPQNEQLTCNYKIEIYDF